MEKKSRCCCANLSRSGKICLIILAVIVAAAIGVGGYALHVYLEVWEKDNTISLGEDAISCISDCVEGIDHSLWDEVLKEVVVENEVRDGISYNAVDFERLRTDEPLREKHKKYMELLATTDLDPLSQDEALAMLINAYNAFAVDLIVEKNPGKSIRDLTDFLKGSVFKRFTWNLLIQNKTVGVNLDSVEHKLIREQITKFSVAEIHSGVNCVSLSCPDLRAEAYTGARVMEQLKEQAASWLQNEGKGLKLDKKKNIIYMSDLFNWFDGDFISVKYGGANTRIDAKEPIDWAIQYATEDVRNYVLANKPAIKYLGYNWGLINPN